MPRFVLSYCYMAGGAGREEIEAPDEASARRIVRHNMEGYLKGDYCRKKHEHAQVNFIDVEQMGD